MVMGIIDSDEVCRAIPQFGEQHADSLGMLITGESYRKSTVPGFEIHQDLPMCLRTVVDAGKLAPISLVLF
jgi:hypothetical protein